MIYYLMGKSASGKDTLYRRLRELDPTLQEVVLYTTRPPRDGEREGVEYHFVDEQALARFRVEGRIIEERTYSTMYGPWTYATVDDGQIREMGRAARYLMIGTLESYVKLRDYFGEAQVRPLYIEVPDALRRERAQKREAMQAKPHMAELERRFAADAVDFSEENIRACGIGPQNRYQNIDMETCANEILKDTRQPDL